MKVVIFNWRDLRHTRAGGAEVATDLLAAGLARRGHSVVVFSSHARGYPPEESHNGYTTIRRGTELTCRLHAFAWLWKNRKNVDVAVDEVNTLPFLSRIILKKRTVVWMHQLAREVWIAEAPPLIGRIGYVLEPLLLSIYRTAPIVTISRSSADSFRSFGLRGPITVAEIMLRPPIGGKSVPIRGRIGYVGRLVKSKRVDHLIRALAIVRRASPSAELFLIGAGEPREEGRLRTLAQQLTVDPFVHFYGRVGSAERDELMQTFEALALASMREGWGLVVSEAARFGVPSVVYPVAGLVDSVRNGETGLVAEEESPTALAAALGRVLGNAGLRDRLGERARRYLLEFDESRFIGRFEAVLESTARSRPRTP